HDQSAESHSDRSLRPLQCNAVASIRSRKMDNRSAEPSRIRRRVRPIQNKVRARQDASNDFALHAATLAVNDADDAKTSLMCFAQIFFDDSFYLARRYGVESKHVCDFDHHGFRKRRCIISGHGIRMSDKL